MSLVNYVENIQKDYMEGHAHGYFDNRLKELCKMSPRHCRANCCGKHGTITFGECTYDEVSGKIDNILQE